MNSFLAIQRADLVLAGHDDVLWFRGGCVQLDLQRVRLQSWVAVGGEEAVVLLHAQRGPGQLAPGKIHRQSSPDGRRDATIQTDQTLMTLNMGVYEVGIQ